MPIACPLSFGPKHAAIVLNAALGCWDNSFWRGYCYVLHLLAGQTPTCVSSQDDRPYPFVEPWAYDGPFERAMSRLRSYLEINGAKVSSVVVMVLLWRAICSAFWLHA